MKQTLVYSVLVSLWAMPSYGQYVNGYAVANHRSCGASNLPATVTELDKFFSSRYFPSDAQKNVYYKDASVNADHWGNSGDYFENTNASSGLDGADASLISYIASHGVTSNGHYTALAGGSTGGCNIKTSAMSAGDQNARYLILSTCQGLKIGTGDSPTRPGENPSVTWKDANKGLNCIFGYSNNMVDASEYGNYFLENLATSDETLAQAFMRASRRVSSSNIPAVMCFGVDNAAAKEHLETTKRFVSARVGVGASSWTHSRAKIVEGVLDQSALKSRSAVARTLAARPSLFSAQKIAKNLLGEQFQDQSLTKNLGVYRSSKGVVTYNRENGFFSYVKAGSEKSSAAMKVSDEAAVRIAEAWLSGKSFLKAYIGSFVPSYVIDRYVGNESASELVEKIVTFSQASSGIAALGSSGSIEVTIGGQGEVMGLSGALLEIEKKRVTEWLDVSDIDFLKAEQLALASVKRKMPGAQLLTIQTLVGYDSGDYSAPAANLKIVAEILIEARQGDFSRRYIERIPL